MNTLKNLDNDPDGPWDKSDLTVRTSGYQYEIPSLDGKKVFNSRWRFDEKKMKMLMNGGENETFLDIYKRGKWYKDTSNEKKWFVVGKIVFTSNQSKPSFKKYSKDTDETINNTLYDGIGTNKSANAYLKAILGPNVNFNNPKPVELIKYFINLNPNKNAVVLDFFAGSGTTGQAVQELNKQDNGERKYILCTNNENFICENITYIRLKKTQKYLPHNLIYLKANLLKKSRIFENFDFFEKFSIPLIFLENMKLIDDKTISFINYEANTLEMIKNIHDNCLVYVDSSIFLTQEEKLLLKLHNANIKEIPEYFYRAELDDLGI